MTTFRLLDPHGAPQDFEILLACIGNLYRELFGEGAVPTAELRTKLARQLADRPAHWAFVGTQTGHEEPIAFFTLAESFAVFAHGRYGILNELWVAPQWRSQGVGELAIANAAEFGRTRDWERIDVTAPPDARWDRTFAFYQRHGFTPTGRKLKLYL